jgi:hypothetical protein
MGLPVRFLFAACFFLALPAPVPRANRRLIPDSIHNPIKGHEKKTGVPQNLGELLLISAVFRPGCRM